MAKLTPSSLAARNSRRIMCGGCKATGVALGWNVDGELIPIEPRRPCPTCNGSGFAPQPSLDFDHDWNSE